jgi:HSP20 family protein
MTLLKFKNSNGSNTNVQTRNNQTNAPYNSEQGSMWMPSLFNNFPRSFFGRDLIQDLFDDEMGINYGTIGTSVPAVNISETDNDLIIEVAAPGMRKQDFKVEINDNQLRIGYNRESKNENSESNHWRREFNFESFERTFSLPAIVESEKISAGYTDGILRISVPKKEEARRKPARAIEIK